MSKGWQSSNWPRTIVTERQRQYGFILDLTAF